MDNVNNGITRAQVKYTIKSSEVGFEWDVDFSGNAIYMLKSYGNLGVVSAAVKIFKSDKKPSKIRGSVCTDGYILNKETSFIVDDKGNFYLSGVMLGSVVGKNDRKVVQKSSWKENFTQNFDESSNWGIWSGDYSINNSEGKVFGSGQLIFGDPIDPVDTVEQSVKGMYSKGIYSWKTTSTLKSESKVRLTIKNKDDGTIVDDGNNKVTAAAQSRDF